MRGPAKNICLRAREATGLTQTRFGILLGRSQARISEWEKNKDNIEEYHECILRRIATKCGKDAKRMIPWLLSEDRVAEALILALGGVVPGPLEDFAQIAEKTLCSASPDPTEAEPTPDGSSPGLAS